MANLYWKYVDPPAESDSKGAFASVLRSGEPALGISAGALSLGNGGAARLKTTRAYGGERTQKVWGTT